MDLDSGLSEPSAAHSLERWVALANSPTGVLAHLIDEGDYFPDEPRWPLMRAEVPPTRALAPHGFRRFVACGGRGLREGAASTTVSAIFEGLERYCLSLRNERRLVHGSEESLAESHTLVPVAAFMDGGCGGARLAAERARVRPWVPASLLDSSSTPVLVPAQFVYVPYMASPDEPLLRDPLTTGAASGMSKAAAAVRGLLEVVERDAVMLLHYGGAEAARVPADSLGADAAEMVAELGRFEIDVDLLRVETGLPAHAVAVRLGDRRGAVPRFTVGSCARFALNDAVAGALAEAAVYRRSLRSRSRDRQSAAVANDMSSESIDSLERRSAYWQAGDRLTELDYFNLPARKATGGDLLQARFTAGELVAAVSQVSPIAVVDVTTPDIAGAGAWVVKVVAPGLQPMHLNESLATFGRRLAAARGASTSPHPFL